MTGNNLLSSCIPLGRNLRLECRGQLRSKLRKTFSSESGRKQPLRSSSLWGTNNWSSCKTITSTHYLRENGY